jgi:hypothetical protein
VLASYLAMYAAATIAVPKDAIARPSTSAKAVRSSRILFEGRGISVSDLLRIIPEMIACSRSGYRTEADDLAPLVHFCT